MSLFETLKNINNKTNNNDSKTINKLESLLSYRDKLDKLTKKQDTNNFKKLNELNIDTNYYLKQQLKLLSENNSYLESIKKKLIETQKYQENKDEKELRQKRYLKDNKNNSNFLKNNIQEKKGIFDTVKNLLFSALPLFAKDILKGIGKFFTNPLDLLSKTSTNLRTLLFGSKEIRDGLIVGRKVGLVGKGLELGKNVLGTASKVVKSGINKALPLSGKVVEVTKNVVQNSRLINNPIVSKGLELGKNVVNATRPIGNFLTTTASKTGGFISNIVKGVGNYLAPTLESGAVQTASTTAKVGGSFLGKILPAVGVALSGGQALADLGKGDLIGASLNGLSALSSFVGMISGGTLAPVTSTISAILTAIDMIRKGQIQEVFNSLSEGLTWVTSIIKGFLKESFPNVAKGIEKTTNFISDTYNSISNLITNTTKSIINTVSSITGFISNMVTSIPNTLSNMTSYVINGIFGMTTSLTGSLDTVKNTVTSVWDSTKSFFTDSFNSVMSWGTNVITGIKNFFNSDNIINALTNVLKGTAIGNLLTGSTNNNTQNNSSQNNTAQDSNLFKRRIFNGLYKSEANDSQKLKISHAIVGQSNLTFGKSQFDIGQRPDIWKKLGFTDQEITVLTSIGAKAKSKGSLDALNSNDKAIISQAEEKIKNNANIVDQLDLEQRNNLIDTAKKNIKIASDMGATFSSPSVLGHFTDIANQYAPLTSTDIRDMILMSKDKVITPNTMLEWRKKYSPSTAQTRYNNIEEQFKGVTSPNLKGTDLLNMFDTGNINQSQGFNSTSVQTTPTANLNQQTEALTKTTTPIFGMGKLEMPTSATTVNPNQQKKALALASNAKYIESIMKDGAGRCYNGVWNAMEKTGLGLNISSADSPMAYQFINYATNTQDGKKNLDRVVPKTFSDLQAGDIIVYGSHQSDTGKEPGHIEVLGTDGSAYSDIKDQGAKQLKGSFKNGKIQDGKVQIFRLKGAGGIPSTINPITTDTNVSMSNIAMGISNQKSPEDLLKEQQEKDDFNKAYTSSIASIDYSAYDTSKKFNMPSVSTIPNKIIDTSMNKAVQSIKQSNNQIVTNTDNSNTKTLRAYTQQEINKQKVQDEMINSIKELNNTSPTTTEKKEVPQANISIPNLFDKVNDIGLTMVNNLIFK